jgi:hypothetical protein
LRRRRIRSDLTEWCRYCGYEPAAHHRLLIDRLEKVARGEINRLAVFMPPGSAKSTYGSVLFPSWFMAAHPGVQVLGGGGFLAARVGSATCETSLLIGLGGGFAVSDGNGKSFVFGGICEHENQTGSDSGLGEALQDDS